MGGTTFDSIGIGRDANDAFREVRDRAAYENGHGGYTGTIAEKGDFTVITRTPLSLVEANALAYRLIDEDDLRITDKWGPAGAIPVVLPTRTVNSVGPFNYVYNFDDDPAQEQLADLVKPLVKLRAGEKINRVSINSYNTPDVYSYSRSRSAHQSRTNVMASVEISKPPLSREVPFKATINPSRYELAGGRISFDDLHKTLLEEARTSITLKPGEEIVSVSTTSSTPSKPKITALAPKEPTVTRFIVEGSRQHGTWETGFPTQAEARAYATEVAGRTGTGPFDSPNDLENWAVVGITKRESGAPLVTVTRTVDKRVHEAVATVSKKPTGEPDGWLFFGWASC